MQNFKKESGFKNQSVKNTENTNFKNSFKEPYVWIYLKDILITSILCKIYLIMRLMSTQF